MKGRLLTVAIAGMLTALLGAGPASARSDETITITCLPTGFTIVVDASALAGQHTANEVYNRVNPFGETCSVVAVG